MKTYDSLALAAVIALPGAHALAAGTPIGDPYYAYYLYEHRQVPSSAPGHFDFVQQLGKSGAQHGGVLLQVHELGASRLGFTAADMVSGYNDGKTFWSQTLSPRLDERNRDIVGGTSEIFIAQSFRKNTAAATLGFSFTAGRLELMDFGAGREDGYQLDAGARFAVHVINHDTGQETFNERQSVRLYEHFGTEPGALDNTWQFTVTQDQGPLTRGLAPWSWQCENCGDPAVGFVRAELIAPYGAPIPLDFIAVGSEFTVSFYLMTYATDERQGETSALAYAKDPLSDDGLGVGFEFSGLTPTDRPIVTAIPEPGTWLLMALGVAAVALRTRAEGATRPPRRLCDPRP